MKHATQLEKNSGFRWLVCFVGYRFIKTASGNSPTCARLRRASPLPKTCREQIGRPGLRRAEGWGNDVARSLCARCVTRKRLQAIRSRFVWSSRNKMSEHLRRSCHRRFRTLVFLDLSQKWLRKFLELLLSDARDLREFAFSWWAYPRHLAQRCIGKNDVSGDITLIGNFSPQRAQTLEEFFVAFDLARPRGANLLRWCLD